MKKCLLYLAIALLLAIPQPALAQNLNLGQGMVSVDIETPDDGTGEVVGISNSGVDVELTADGKNNQGNNQGKSSDKTSNTEEKPSDEPEPGSEGKKDNKIEIGDGIHIYETDDGTKDIRDPDPEPPGTYTRETEQGHEGLYSRKILHWEWEFINLTDTSVPKMTAKSPGAALQHTQRFPATGEWLCIAVPYCRWDRGYYETETITHYDKDGNEIYRETKHTFTKTGEEEKLYPPGKKEFKVYIHVEDIDKEINLPPTNQGDLGVVSELVR